MPSENNREKVPLRYFLPISCRFLPNNLVIVKLVAPLPTFISTEHPIQFHENSKAEVKSVLHRIGCSFSLIFPPHCSQRYVWDDSGLQGSFQAGKSRSFSLRGFGYRKRCWWSRRSRSCFLSSIQTLPTRLFHYW
jgi:hypothetical protein